MINRIKPKRPGSITNSKNKSIVIIEDTSKVDGVNNPIVTITSLPSIIKKIKTKEKLVEVDEPQIRTYRAVKTSVNHEETIATTNQIDVKTSSASGIKIENAAGDVSKLVGKNMAAQLSKNVWVVTSDVFDDLERLEKANSLSHTKKTLFEKDIKDGKSLTVAELLAIRIKNIEASNKVPTVESQWEHLARYRLRQEYGIGALITKNIPKESVSVTSYTKVTRQSSRYHLIQEIGGDKRKRYIRVLSLFISSERALSRRIAQQERALIKAQSRSRNARSKLKIIRRSRFAKR